MAKENKNTGAELTPEEVLAQNAELKAQNEQLQEHLGKLVKENAELAAAAKTEPGKKGGKTVIKHGGKNYELKYGRFKLGGKEYTAKHLQADDELVKNVLAVPGQGILTLKTGK